MQSHWSTLVDVINLKEIWGTLILVFEYYFPFIVEQNMRNQNINELMNLDMKYNILQKTEQITHNVLSGV